MNDSGDSPQGSKSEWSSRSGGRLKVSLRISGDDLDPAEITRLLGIEPTFTAKRGEIVTHRNRTYAQRRGTWTFRSHEQAGWNLDRALEDLFAQLPGERTLWSSLCERFNVDVFCGLFMGDDNQCDRLSPSSLQLLSERSVAVSFDVYRAF